MIITAAQASTLATAAKLKSSTFEIAEKLETTPAEGSTKVTISSASLQKAAESEGQTDEGAGPYRLTGPATLVSLLHPVAYKMPESLVQEMEVRAKEEAARNEINSQYASQHRYQPIGQVLVDGKLYAEVDDAGGFGSVDTIPGLSGASLSPRERVEEIAGALKDKGNVEIRYSDFVPGLGGSGGPGAPESMLPHFTARNIHEIFAEAMEAAKRLRSTSLPSSDSAAST